MDPVVHLAGNAAYAGIPVDLTRMYDHHDPAYLVFVAGVLEVVNELHRRHDPGA